MPTGWFNLFEQNDLRKFGRCVGRTLLYVTYSKLCNKFTVAHHTFTVSLSASLLYCLRKLAQTHRYGTLSVKHTQILTPTRSDFLRLCWLVFYERSWVVCKRKIAISSYFLTSYG
jgi:hypothetical protein